MKHKTEELALKLEQKHEDKIRNKRQQKDNFAWSLSETHRECVVVAGLGMGGGRKSHKYKELQKQCFLKSQMVNVSGSWTTRFLRHLLNAAFAGGRIHRQHENECDYVPLQLHSRKQASPRASLLTVVGHYAVGDVGSPPLTEP